LLLSVVSAKARPSLPSLGRQQLPHHLTLLIERSLNKVGRKVWQRWVGL